MKELLCNLLDDYSRGKICFWKITSDMKYYVWKISEDTFLATSQYFNAFKLTFMETIYLKKSRLIYCEAGKKAVLQRIVSLLHLISQIL